MFMKVRVICNFHTTNMKIDLNNLVSYLFILNSYYFSFYLEFFFILGKIVLFLLGIVQLIFKSFLIIIIKKIKAIS